jgi:manganese oxidase
MRAFIAAVLVSPLLAGPSTHAPPTRIEQIITHDNRTPTGTLRGGVLTIRLEVREGEWRPERDSDPAIVVRAFAEAGKQLSVPGPLIRVPEGTEIRAAIRNTFTRGTLVIRGLSTRGTSAAANDTIQIPAGSTRDVRFIAGVPGTYYYSGTLEGAPGSDLQTRDAELSGVFVIDPRSPSRVPSDRIFLIALWRADSSPGAIIGRTDVLRFTINGKSWPYTERLSYSIGDTVRFRLVNASIAPHPMHLHGFYFNVDSRGDGAIDSVYDRRSPRLVVTERVAPGRTISMTWVPERPGNWMFHCHDNYHVLRNAPLDGTALPAEHMLHATNHAVEMMGGLVMGIEVKGRSAAEVVAQSEVRRHLRLVAREDSGGTDAEPAYGYVLHAGAKSTTATRPLLPGPTILLERGKPVSITVVNELREPTSVHWHGIELESYFDGVADFAGVGRRIAPAIAPRDSFEARFTPPRSGTFIYHPHADEVRQQQAGMSGALLVVDSPASFDPVHDIVILLSVPRLSADGEMILINGSKTPAPLELRVGERYRLRIVDIHTYRPSMIVRVLRGETPVVWRALAKDGMGIPAERATQRPAVQQMGNGETYDFELAPTAPGDLRLTVTSNVDVLLASMPIRVRSQ